MAAAIGPFGDGAGACRAGWVHRYNEEDLAGLADRPRSGRPCGLDEGQQAALKALVLRGPKLERDGCVAWRLRDLCGLVERRFGIGYSETGLLTLLKRLDLSWQKARPVHPEADLKAQARFKRVADAAAGDRRRPSRGQADRAVVRG
jgi:transposase